MYEVQWYGYIVTQDYGMRDRATTLELDERKDSNDNAYSTEMGSRIMALPPILPNMAG